LFLTNQPWSEGVFAGPVHHPWFGFSISGMLYSLFKEPSQASLKVYNIERSLSLMEDTHGAEATTGVAS
jgi:hypothetical protein